jgi:asparaginyl-tRNA synthetase
MRIKDLLVSQDFGNEVTVKGWVRTKRGNKNISFIALNDGSIIHNIQVVLEMQKFDEELLKKVTTGSCIAVTGNLVASPGKEQHIEIHASKMKLYGTADAETYPLQKKGHT